MHSLTIATEIIDTQVCDVSIALALDRTGEGIRLSGFKFVQADPLLGFRDFSLGFASDKDREQALKHALASLNAN